MPGREYAPTPKEIRNAEESMEPSWAAMTRARWDIMSHAQDLKAAGVAEEQVKNAAELAAKRAKQEFEQKEKEDPYRRIAKVMEDAAETPEEKELAVAMISRLEEHRAQTIHGAQKADALEITGEDLGRALEKADQLGVFMTQDAFTDKYQSRVNIVPTRIGDKYVEFEKVFVERVLRALGALGPNKSLDSLASLPEDPSKNPGKAYYDKFFRNAMNLSTSIEGIGLDVELKKPYQILVKANMDRVRQIIHFPES